MVTALIVDDSMWIRTSIRKVLEEMNFKKILEARNGIDAVTKTELLQPDLVLLDVIMPKMDGLTALEQIMEKCPTKVIVMSAFGPAQTNVAFQALEKGALDFIPKPSTEQAPDYSFKQELIIKVTSCLQAKSIIQKSKLKKIEFESVLSDSRLRKKWFGRFRSISSSLIVIGASTGGPKLINHILSNLNKPISPVIILQHLATGFSSRFASRLDQLTQLKVVEAKEGMVLNPNNVYVAPGGKHLVFEENLNLIKIKLFKGDPVNGVQPSLDPTLVSASYHYSDNLIVAILSGMGNDGLAGARYAAQNGAFVIAQDETSSLIYGMPKAIVEANLADYTGNPNQICSLFNQLFKSGSVN